MALKKLITIFPFNRSLIAMSPTLTSIRKLLVSRRLYVSIAYVKHKFYDDIFSVYNCFQAAWSAMKNEVLKTAKDKIQKEQEQSEAL
jgi:hypothetical protein